MTAYFGAAAHPTATTASNEPVQIRMASFCYTPPVVVHTVGHSTRTLAAFLDLLAAHAVAGVADVRRYPASRRHPHFAREALAAALVRAGLSYDWLPQLGGHRTPRPDSPHTAWRVDAFRGYADHMATPEFHVGLSRLRSLAGTRPTAVMCAEAAPESCHRRLLSDTLLTHGIDVRHIVDGTTPVAHELTSFARVVDGAVVYDVGQLPLSLNGGG